MSDNFYRDFEERFRGSRELIKERLKFYLPFVQPLHKYHEPAHAMDLGCGRGEWLELLNENGFEAQGVDLDDSMLAACRERGLNVSTGDAIKLLREFPDVSQSVISGFHIAEHIPFESLQELIKESLRALKPGGLLILETPNPENIVVATCSFYLDPTHQRPIPPQLLAFLPEHGGFMRTKLLRLQESKDLTATTRISLLAVLNGASPDYAVVAQKNGPVELVSALDSAFNAEYGLTLEALASRYQQQTEERITHAEAQAAQANERASHAEAQATQANERANTARQQLEAVVNSRSWKITKPLRLASKFSQWFTRGSIAWLTFAPGSRPRRVMRTGLISAMNKVRSRPGLKMLALKALNKFPRLKQRLWNITFAQAGIHVPQYSTPSVEKHDVGAAHLSPRARQIYADLKAAIEKHNKEGA